jgi:hypothetical protein
MPTRDRLSEAYGVVKSGHWVSNFCGRSSEKYRCDMPLDRHELINRYSANPSRQDTIDLPEDFPGAEVEGWGFIRTGIARHEPDRRDSPLTPYITYCGNVSDPRAVGAGQLRAIFARYPICTCWPKDVRWSDRS